MSTKGPSKRYGNTKGSNHRGLPTKHIGYAWAKGFNRGGLKRHFKEHGKEFNTTTKEEYEAKALHFANTVDRTHYKSVIDYKGTTYKYDTRDGRLVIVDKKGIVISYHHTGDKFHYKPQKWREITLWIKH